MAEQKVKVSDVVKWYMNHPKQAITNEDIKHFAKKVSVYPFDQKMYIIGGAAVQLLGSKRVTRDVDMVFDDAAAMEKTIQGLINLKTNDAKSGFVWQNGINGVYWYKATAWWETGKFDQVILFDMHVASAFDPPYPIMPSHAVPSLDGIPIAPTLLIVYFKLIACASDMRPDAKKATDFADLTFLLTLPTIMPPVRPDWLVSPEGIRVHNMARQAWLGFAKHFPNFNGNMIF